MSLENLLYIYIYIYIYISSSNGLFHWTALYRYIYGNRVEQAHHRCNNHLLYTLQWRNVSLFYKILINHDLVKLPETLYIFFSIHCRCRRHRHHHHHHNHIERLDRQLNVKFALL